MQTFRITGKNIFEWAIYAVVFAMTATSSFAAAIPAWFGLLARWNPEPLSIVLAAISVLALAGFCSYWLTRQWWRVSRLCCAGVVGIYFGLAGTGVVFILSGISLFGRIK